MFCNKCGKEIAADSLFCSYCGAGQPGLEEGRESALQAEEAAFLGDETPVKNAAAPTPEPYQPSFLGKVAGKIIGLLLIGFLIAFIYILSKNQVVLFEGMTTVMNRITTALRI